MAGAPVRGSFRSSALMNYATNVGSSVLSLGNVLVIARTLDTTGRGQVAFLTTVAIIASSLAALGIPPATATFAGRRPALTGSLASNAVLAAIASGGAAVGVVAALLVAFPGMGGDVSRGLMWVSLATVPVIIAGMSLQAAAVAHYGFRAVNVAWITTPVVTVTANGTMAALGELTVGRALASWVSGQCLTTPIQAGYVWRRPGGLGQANRAPGPAVPR